MTVPLPLHSFVKLNLAFCVTSNGERSYAPPNVRMAADPQDEKHIFVVPAAGSVAPLEVLIGDGNEIGEFGVLGTSLPTIKREFQEDAYRFTIYTTSQNMPSLPAWYRIPLDRRGQVKL